MDGLLLLLRPGWPELDMLGDNNYPGYRQPFGIPGMFLFEPPDNPYPPSFASVLLTLQRQVPGGFNVETAGFFFHAVVGFEKTAGGKRKPANGITSLVRLVIGFSNQVALKQD
jgi:hypothetical protein